MKRYVLLGLLALALTGCESGPSLFPAMDAFSIDRKRLDREPRSPEELRELRENLRSQPPGHLEPERIHGGII